MGALSLSAIRLRHQLGRVRGQRGGREARDGVGDSKSYTRMEEGIMERDTLALRGVT